MSDTDRLPYNGIQRATALLLDALQDGRLDAEGFHHALRVSGHFGRGQEHRAIVALLHDTVEDGVYSLSDIEKHFSKGIARDVQTLTKGERETYAEYITRVRTKGSEAALAVKQADAADNLDRCVRNPESEKSKRLIDRYKRARLYLSFRTQEF